MLSRKVGDLQLPIIGLGTFGLKEQHMQSIIHKCINEGVNYIDSANRYENEAQLGIAIKKLGIKRNEIIIGTKLSYRQQISQKVCEAVDESLEKLQVDYVDLYMIHSPKSRTYCEDWIALQTEKRKGKILEIAVSNFSVEQLKELYKVSGIYPVLNQIEVNLVHIPRELIEFCRSKNIIIQASCPLYRMGLEAVNRKNVKEVMHRHQKSYAQIVLRWLYQKELLSVPKMSIAEHLIENINIFDFELSGEDLLMLENI